MVNVLMLHGVSGSLPATKLAKETSVNTLAETSLPVRRDGTTLLIGRAKVIEADHLCTNGVIHVIDQVLLPIGQPE